MEVSGIALGRRSESVLAERLRAADAAALGYDHAGSTVAGTSPANRRNREHVIEVDGELVRAAVALRAWAPHRGIRGRILPAEAPIAEGTTVLVVAPFGPFELLAPDRIVAVVDEPHRFGFAYGTLVGHPEVGEELFLAEVIDPNRLRLTVRIHAGPATWLARVGSPLVTLFQRAAARRYLRAWANAIEEEP
jgi:uncharacterized protein (UPF0548 family)